MGQTNMTAMRGEGGVIFSVPASKGCDIVTRGINP